MAKSNLIATVAVNGGNFAVKRQDVEQAFRDLLELDFDRNVAAEKAMDLAVGRGVGAHQTTEEQLYGVADSPYISQISLATHVAFQLQRKRHGYMS
jgi:hypothetical protein